MNYLSVNGEHVPADEAKLHVSDLGFLRAYAVFDYFRVIRGVPLFLNDYLTRFERSVGLIGLTLPVSLEQLRSQVHALIEANATQDAGLQLICSGGYAPDGFTPSEPNLVMIERPVKAPSAEAYQAGASLILYDYARDLPEAKTTNYAVALRLLPQQKAAGAVDVLFHKDNRVSETARSNVFIVRDGVLVTPGEGVLRGVTRKHVLELAQQAYEVREAEVTLAELYSADEVFITSTLKGVLPIVKVGDKRIGTGTPGEVARHLGKLFEKYVEAYLEEHSA